MSRYEYETNGYHQAVEDEYEDEYYDEDEYEEEGAGAPEEDEEPPEGQQEFLQIRERLKEQIRRKAQGASASTAGRSSSSHDRRPPPPNFGSFFGPSKPVISQRVIEERKSMKEIQNTVPRERRPPGKDIPSSSRVQVQAKTNGFHQKQKIVNELQCRQKRKLRHLRIIGTIHFYFRMMLTFHLLQGKNLQLGLP
ncbi:unnamed protein product [Triticum turgidum subsp. durum]|uniref:Uncharacterized protein n=1 Tax=Triticum turgidum subsp. durum TaxID=4567 RepID=A0A9R1B857_TRITD|nr:unnamed protein product [Triticum turgidum subsp. durum]